MEESAYEKLISLLSAAGISSPRLEARLLIAAAAGISPDTVNRLTRIDSSAQTKLETMTNARLQRMPLDKILAHKAFYKYDFTVSTDVLSPRPDTETLVECSLDLIKKHQLHHLLDLGTGSGCILISLLAECPETNGLGVDKSAPALKIAAANAQIPDLGNRCRFIEADWAAADFAKNFNQKFDLIVSNPPYIATAEIENLEPEVKNFDPLTALDGGTDGLKCYRELAKIIPGLLQSGGFFVVEIGQNQAADVQNLFVDQGLVHLETQKDLAGIERCIIFRKKDCN